MNETKKGKKKKSWTLRIALTMALAALVFVGLLFYAGLQETVQTLAGFGWAILPAVFGLALSNYAVRFVKWHYYCRLLDIRVGAWDSLLIFMSGLSMSISPGKLGEVLKSFLLSKVTGTPVSYSAPIVVAERLTDLVGLLILSGGSMFFLEFKGWMETTRWVLLGSCVFAVLLVLAMSSRRFAGVFLGMMARLPVVGGQAGKARTLFESAGRLVRPVPLAAASVVSALSWGFECVGFALVLDSLGVETLGFAQAVFVYCTGTLVGAVSMLPGGLGLTEFTLVGALGRFGVVDAVATAATFIIRACTLWFGTVLGALFLVAGRGKFGVSVAEIEELEETVKTESETGETENPAH